MSTTIRINTERQYNPMITLLNTSILTSPGRYEMKPISLGQAHGLVTGQLSVRCSAGRIADTVRSADWMLESAGSGPFYQSAIGHESTAEILTELLGVEVHVNRIEYRQEIDSLAIVFKLKGRPPEGKILSRAELEAIGFEFYLLWRSE